MTKLNAGLRVALFLIFGATASQAEDTVSGFTLSNGMDVVVIEDHRAPVVTHMVWYRAGAADETPGVSGVAHFLEHLLFKGTDTLASGEFSDTVAANGGNDNAFTSKDFTGYFQRVAADRLGTMMEMEADRMVNLRLDEADILTERDVIIEERNQRTENSPGALLNEQMDAAQYLNHPYGTPIIGWRHEMETLSLDDALAYYRTFYAPNNAILIVAGDVTPDEVRQLAEQSYGMIPANPDLPERVRTSEPRHLAERRLVLRDARVSQPYVTRAYLAPERNSGDQRGAAALTLLADILGGGTTSVMAEELQFNQSTAIYTGAYYRAVSLDVTSFDVSIVPAMGVSLQEAEDAMDAVIAQFLEDGVDDDHLARIKTQMRSSQIYARDSVEGIANRYGRALTSGLTVADIQAWPEVLQSVTADEILVAAQQVFDRRASVTGWLTTQEEVTP